MTVARELASLPLRERIAAVIDATGIGQEGVADRIGAPRETVNRWANGHVKPGRGYRQKLADIATEAFGQQVSPDLFRDNPGQPIPLEAAVTALAEATVELIGLLAEQRAVVAQLQTIADALDRRAAEEGT